MVAMRTKHFPKEDNSTKVLKHLVSYKSAKCCPPGTLPGKTIWRFIPQYSKDKDG